LVFFYFNGLPRKRLQHIAGGLGSIVFGVIALLKIRIFMVRSIGALVNDSIKLMNGTDTVYKVLCSIPDERSFGCPKTEKGRRCTFEPFCEAIKMIKKTMR
jgi:hypothetical protein